LWQEDKRRGLPDETNRGRRLGHATLARTKDVANQIAAWPGDAHYLANDRKLNADDVIAALTQAIHTHPKARVAIIDYLQLVTKENTAAVMYDTVLKIKNSLPGRRLFIIAAAQTTKSAASNAQAGNGVLDGQSARYINDDAFNLFLTLNLNYIDGALANYGTIFVAKNSIARARQSVNIGLDLAHLRWIDEIVEVDDGRDE
jgi:hypothetical protein